MLKGKQHSARGRGSSTTPNRLAREQEANNTTLFDYKNIIVLNCFCGTCNVLGQERILSIYKMSHMLEDGSALAFNPFTEKVVK